MNLRIQYRVTFSCLDCLGELRLLRSYMNTYRFIFNQSLKLRKVYKQHVQDIFYLFFSVYWENNFLLSTKSVFFLFNAYNIEFQLYIKFNNLLEREMYVIKNAKLRNIL